AGPDRVAGTLAQEDHGPLSEPLLERAGVQLRLGTAHRRADQRALGLDDAERETVPAPQHVVDAARAGLIRAGEDRQAPDGVLAVLGGVERPPGIVQQLVDQRGACPVPAVDVAIRGYARSMRRRDLFP